MAPGRRHRKKHGKGGFPKRSYNKASSGSSSSEGSPPVSTSSDGTSSSSSPGSSPPPPPPPVTTKEVQLKSSPGKCIRIGADFQATVPDECLALPAPGDYSPEKADQRWSTNHTNLSKQKLLEYIKLAKDGYSYSEEQSLAVLYWHRFDLDKARVDLSRFIPYGQAEEWSDDDRLLFNQAYNFHKHSFHQYKGFLPEKIMPSLIGYYYTIFKVQQIIKSKSTEKRTKKKNSKSPTLQEEVKSPVLQEEDKAVDKVANLIEKMDI